MAREYTTIVLHIAKDHAKDFEELFAKDELKRWDDYTARGRFLEARLIRCRYSALQSDGIQDYVLQVVTAESLRLVSPGDFVVPRRAISCHEHEPVQILVKRNQRHR